MENHRKRRALDESYATVKASRRSGTGDDDVKGDVSSATLDDTRASPRPGSSNDDAAADRKQSLTTCAQCDLAGDERAAASRDVSTHPRRHSPMSSNDDDEVDIETEDALSATTTADPDLRDMFCVHCCIQFTSTGTYRAHRSFYCKRRGKRNAVDGTEGAEEYAAVRRRRRASSGGSSVAERSRARPDDLRPPADVRPAAAFFPPSLAALSSPAGLMEMLSASGAPPPPPPPGAFFLAPFLAAAAAAAAAAAGVPGGGFQPSQSCSSTTAGRQPQRASLDRRSSTSVSDDEPLDLSTCRDVATDSKHDSVSPSAAAAVSPASALGFARQFDSLDAASSLFLPSRLPLNANLPLPVVRPPLSSPPLISHCADCNIVFYKHANYLAHKAHYCAGRRAAPPSADHTGSVSVPAGKSAAMAKADDVACGSTMLDDGRRRSPDPHELVATLDDTGTTIQFYCIPCKIKFSSLDTLRAHKQFYCPARFEAPSGSGSSEQATTTRHRHTARVYGEDGDRQTGDLASAAGGSCTACGARITSPRSGHRCPAAAAATAAVASASASLFQCPHCDYAAQSDSRLVEHVRAHAPSRAFRCALCGYRGNTVRGMRMHGKMHNDEAAAAAGRSGNAVQLPTFTDDCVIEYEEPPAIPPRRHAGGAPAAGNGPARSTVDNTELLRQKNEPYKRRRSRKAYEKVEYATPTAASTTPVACTECLDTTHAQAYATAQAAERLLAWEALYGATTTAKTTAPTAVASVCKADTDVDQKQTTPPVTDESTAVKSLLTAVKLEQSDRAEQNQSSGDNLNNDDDDDDRKSNGTTDMTPVDDLKSAELHDERSSTSPTDADVDVTSCPSVRQEAAAVDEVCVPATTVATDGRRSSPTSVDVPRQAARPDRSPAAPRPTAADGAARRGSALDVATRHCEQCDITFMYASTFVAHKKYYCSSHAAERTDPTAARASAAAATGVAV